MGLFGLCTPALCWCAGTHPRDGEGEPAWVGRTRQGTKSGERQPREPPPLGKSQIMSRRAGHWLYPQLLLMACNPLLSAPHDRSDLIRLPTILQPPPFSFLLKPSQLVPNTEFWPCCLSTWDSLSPEFTRTLAFGPWSQRHLHGEVSLTMACKGLHVSQPPTHSFSGLYLSPCADSNRPMHCLLTTCALPRA